MKTSKLRNTGLCERNSLVTGEFLAQMTSNAENVSIYWRHFVCEMAVTLSRPQCVKLNNGINPKAEWSFNYMYPHLLLWSLGLNDKKNIYLFFHLWVHTPNPFISQLVIYTHVTTRGPFKKEVSRNYLYFEEFNKHSDEEKLLKNITRSTTEPPIPLAPDVHFHWLLLGSLRIML